MKNFLGIAFLLLALAFFTISCSKENLNKTEGEITGEKITAFCQKDQINTALIHLIDYRNEYPYV